ncbi:hypothetical protein ID866_10214 [Astraeus odoratus]|nr:hypothetical protein ID866_10214 [Astraeus odoratus]
MDSIGPPTSYLPQIGRIATASSAQLLDALSYLKFLYNPEVRGSRRIRPHLKPPRQCSEIDSRTLSGDLLLIRSDVFERSYAIRWLTALIGRIENLHHSVDSARPNESIDPQKSMHPDVLIQQAASLLAICAGVAAAGTVQRVFSFESVYAGKIEVQVTDIPLENQDYGSVGAQTWGGACVLAEMIIEHPERFGLGDALSESNDCSRKRNLRILELGAGTGLAGLTVGRLLTASPTRRNTRCTIVSTDFHPSVLENLQRNIETNFPESASDCDDRPVTIVSQFLDWSSFCVVSPEPALLSEPFDVVLGADIIYEAEHAAWIKGCLKRLLRRHEPPTPSDTATPAAFHLVIPLRPTHSFESSTIEKVFRWEDHSVFGDDAELVILSKESIFCEAHGDARAGRGNEDIVEYVYYRIGWKNGD